jgi:nucleotide-binding universal stress UspA family protein
VAAFPPDDRSVEPSANLQTSGPAPVDARRMVAEPRTRTRRMLLATDLSSASEHAAAEAIRLAVAHGAELIVLSVVDPRVLRMAGGRFLRRVDQERARVEGQAQTLVLRARAAGARATFLVWEGDAAETILSASESERADVIVLGSHERGRLGRLVLGSISTHVKKNARCLVLVIPPESATTPSIDEPEHRSGEPDAFG